MNEPRLRFKADDESQFPDWEEKKFANLYRKNVEKNVNLEFDSSKTISIASMQFNEKGNGASEDSLSSYKVLRLGDIAFEGHENKEYSHGRFVLNDIGDGIMSPRFSCMRPVCTQVDGFWKYYIHSERVMKNILVRSTKKGTMMHELVIPDFLKQSIMVPSLPEQQKIAEFLSTIDTVIKKQKETVSVWEERKKGVMQKLFSQEVRFKADDGSEFPEWEEKKLGEVGDIVTGNTPSTKQNDYYGECYLWVTPTDITDSREVTSTAKMLTELGYTVARHIPANSILVTCIASIGKNAILRENGSCNQQINSITPYDEYSVEFVYYLICQNEKLLHANAGTGGMEILNKENFSKIKMYFPCFAEQQKIADCLSSLDEVIEKQKATLAAWEELKKGLLQQMFV